MREIHATFRVHQSNPSQAFPRGDDSAVVAHGLEMAGDGRAWSPIPHAPKSPLASTDKKPLPVWAEVRMSVACGRKILDVFLRACFPLTDPHRIFRLCAIQHPSAIGAHIHHADSQVSFVRANRQHREPFANEKESAMLPRHGNDLATAIHSAVTLLHFGKNHLRRTEGDRA